MLYAAGVRGARCWLVGVFCCSLIASGEHTEDVLLRFDFSAGLFFFFHDVRSLRPPIIIKRTSRELKHKKNHKNENIKKRSSVLNS